MFSGSSQYDELNEAVCGLQHVVKNCFSRIVLSVPSTYGTQGSPRHYDAKTVQSVGFSKAKNHHSDFLACGLVPFLMIHCIPLPVTSLFHT